MSISKLPRILGNRLLVEPIADESTSGIVIPDNIKPRTDYARVVAIGTGSKIPVELKVGQRLRIDTEFGVAPFVIDGRALHIVSIYDTVAIMDYRNGA